MNKQSIGLLGMSGNPTHGGHIATVDKVLMELPFKEAWLLINPHNPLKDPAQFAPFEHRMQLAKYELAANPVSSGRIDVSDYEQSLRERAIPNETIHTLRQFEADHPDYNPIWIMGADILASMHTWGGEWNRIFEEYPVIVISRPGDHTALSRSVAGRAFSHLAVQPAVFTGRKGTWTFLESANHPGSSSEVRTMVATGRKPQYLSDESFEHMMKHGLYGATQ